MDSRVNHPGATEHAKWLHEVFAEFLVLGVVSEVPYRPKVVNPMNVIPKGDYDPGHPVKRNRLRLLLDQRFLPPSDSRRFFTSSIFPLSSGSANPASAG